jgi:hypothetical protein
MEAQMNNPKVYADFQNADRQGRVRLNCVGTVEDLAQHHIVLREGLVLTLYSEELEVAGRVHYSSQEHLWVAAIDWDAIREVEAESSPSGGQQIKPRKIA